MRDGRNRFAQLNPARMPHVRVRPKMGQADATGARLQALGCEHRFGWPATAYFARGICWSTRLPIDASIASSS